MIMTLKKRIECFVALGDSLLWLASKGKKGKPAGISIDRLSEIAKAIPNSSRKNQWFMSVQIRQAMYALGSSLQRSKLEKWIYSYTEISDTKPKKRIGVIMAGNIPFVGAHDLLSVLISGNKFIGKSSSKETGLMEILAEVLIKLEPGFQDLIHFSNDLPENIDAIIATGSDNTSRYFDYHYRGLPSLIRKNRNGVAVLEGIETSTELENLGNDIFSYFGLGCRNVAKLFVPEKYNFTKFIKTMQKNSYVLHHSGYAANYKYQRTLAEMDKIPFIDTGLFILKEDPQISSPIGVLFFQQYKTIKELNNILNLYSEKIQCIVGNTDKNYTAFGKAQYPELWDYADNIDTIRFLISL